LKIVFANEAGSVLKAQGVDSREVLRIFCQDRQLNISAAYLKPGFAFGGSCLPKEVKGFLTMARQLNVAVPSMGGLLESNEVHIERAYQLIAQGGRRPLALFGLAFKPGTDDLRDSPLVALAERLLGRGYELVIRDPNVKLSRLLGKNKEFVEREVPHLDRLLVEGVDQALSPSVRAVIVGHATPEDRAAILAAADRVQVIDLAGYADLKAGCPSYEGICW
jgi:GDP-mannose 6-dehydrogenase